MLKIVLPVAATALLGAAFQPSVYPTAGHPTAGHPTAGAPPGEGVFQIDGVHSSVVFKVKHLDTSWFYGVFGKVEGSFDLGAGGKVEVKIAADSVDTRDEARDKHLRGPDFFDSKQYPDITFVSSTVETKGKDSFAVTGDLALRGKKRPLTMTVQKTGEGEMKGKRVGYETTFTVKRSEFGMDYGVAKNALSDEVTLTIAVEGVQAAAGK